MRGKNNKNQVALTVYLLDPQLAIGFIGPRRPHVFRLCEKGERPAVVLLPADGEFVGKLARADFALEPVCHCYIPPQESSRPKIEQPIPEPGERRFLYTKQGKLRSQTGAECEWEAEVRRRWRVLLLLIKAKLEAVDIGNSTLQKEFLADALLPSGETVGRWAERDLRAAIESGQMPRSMLALPEASGLS